MARDHEQTPTPIRHPGASQTGKIDVEAIEQLQAEVEARARRYFVALLARLAQWLGLAGIGGLGGYGIAATSQADDPQQREQPASGPEPTPVECPPSADLIDAQEQASRDARKAIATCRELGEELERRKDTRP